MLFVLPTGGGKTIVFIYILVAAVARGKRVLVLVHRVELVDRIIAVLDLHGVPHGVIASGSTVSKAPVQVAMVAPLVRRLDRWRDAFDFLVADEGHHSVAGSWARVLASQPRAPVLGVTATPERLDGRGLGEIFDDLVIGPCLNGYRPGWVYYRLKEIRQTAAIEGIRG